MEAADVTFRPGLNLLTGETGSGKSLLLDALGLALGDRAQPDLVRHGAGRARVEALFRPPGSTEGEAVLAIVREVGRRTSARVNGEPTSPAHLRELGQTLVAVHGQAGAGAHHPLRDAEQQALLLDGFSGSLPQRERLAARYAEWRQAEARAADLERLQARGQREREYLEWQLAELCAAGLRPGEEAELRAERAVVRHAARLRELTAAATESLTAEEGLQVAAGRLQQAAELDPGLGDLAARLAALGEEAADIAHEVRRYGEALSGDPQRLDAIESRLAQLELLKRKYGGSVEAAIEERDRLEAQLGQMQDLEGSLEAARQASAIARAACAAAAGELSARRREGAGAMAAAVTAELAGLHLPGARFEVQLLPQELAPDGAESVAMLFSANPGEPLAAVQRVASGGELARLLLAIKTVGPEADRVPTIVFDEVDAGIGGEAAGQVGRRLKRLARHRQVLVVTHLPQIASYADHHLLVEKRPEPSGRNVVRVRVLADPDERARELARMMGGKVTGTGLARAQELLAEAAV